MRQVLPEARWQRLDATHPIFHSFFDINALPAEGYYGAAPSGWGIFEDNDPDKRLLADRELQPRPGRVLGVLRHRLHAGRPVERGVQVRRELRHVRDDALRVKVES